MGEAETVPVTATVLRVERIDAGRVLALASVEILIAGIAFTLHGVRVVKTGPRSRGFAAPCYRSRDGRWLDTIDLPAELAAAIADAILDEHGEMRRPSCAPPAIGTPCRRR